MAENSDHDIVFSSKLPFLCRKWSKMAENSDHDLFFQENCPFLCRKWPKLIIITSTHQIRELLSTHQMPAVIFAVRKQMVPIYNDLSRFIQVSIRVASRVAR
jgi:hypothetical protein